MRYLPETLSNQILTALAVELYTKILNKNGKVAGKYVEKFTSWTFPLENYFEFVTNMKSIETENFENLELIRLPTGIETYLRNDSNSQKYIEPKLTEKLRDGKRIRKNSFD